MDDYANSTSAPWYGQTYTKVVIADGVTTIGDNAFAWGTNLTSVNIPSTVKKIGQYAFYRCTKLTGVTIPDGVTAISNDTFAYCTALTSVKIPSTVTAIGTNAFYECKGLTSIEIPSNVTIIGNSAFYDCTALRSVTIPVSVTEIYANAFHGCAALADVWYGGTQDQWNAITIDRAGNDPLTSAKLHCTGGSAGDNVTWALSGTTLTISGSGPMTNYQNPTAVPWYGENIEKVVIASGVTTIGDLAFCGCDALTDVTIPEGVTSIGNSAFQTCGRLTSVTIPASVTTIDNGAFAGSGLTSVSIPAGVSTIGESMFSGCTKLTSVTIPNTVNKIGNSAFYACNALTDVYYGGTEEEWNTLLPNIVSNNDPLKNAEKHYVDASGSAGENVMWAISGDTLTFSGTGEMIGYSSTPLPWWSEGRDTIKTVVIESGVTNIGQLAFKQYENLTSVTIPDSVTTIGYMAFQECTSLASVEIPDTVTSIEGVAFSHTPLTSVTIPAGVTRINMDTFEYCTSLTSVTILGSVTNIDSYAFQGCSSLTNVTIPDTVTEIGNHAFDRSGLTSVTIPAGVTKIGEGAFAETALTEFQVDGGNTAFALIDGVLFNKDKTTLIAYPSRKGSTYTVPNSVTSIKNYAFTGSGLTSVNIPTNVTSIGECAFQSCKSLTSVDIPNTVTTINRGVFNGCTALTNVTIPNSVTTIGSKAFQNCTGLTSVTIPDTATSIGENAFEGSGLTSVNIPSGVTKINDYVFQDCASLTSVTIPESVTSIGIRAFDGCSALTNVTIPSNVTTIGSSTFADCSGLTSVTIPASVTSVGSYAFYNCTALTTVNYTGIQEQWNAITIDSGNDPLTNATINYNYTPSTRAVLGGAAFPVACCAASSALLRTVIANAAPVYADVPADAWYAEAVAWCREQGLMVGTGGGKFSPDRTMTRAMLVTVLHRLAGAPAASSPADFPDVKAGQWYTEAVSWASSEKIVLGYPSGRFGTSDPVTHEQLALILQRCGGDPAFQTVGADTPKNPTTRAEAAAALMDFAKGHAAPGTLSVFSAMDVMCSPSGIAADRDGSLLVTDVYHKQIWRVLRRASENYAGGATVEDLYGRPLGGYNDAGLGDSYFKEPWAIAPFLDGWAVTDTANNVVRLIQSDGVQTLNGTTGEKLKVTDLGVVFDHPTGLAADGKGNLYVSDTFNGAVRKVTPEGGVSTVVKDLSEPTGLCWKDGALYIAETGANRIIMVADGKLSLLAGSGTAALTDGAAKRAAFSAPQGVAVGDDGSVYVADTGNGAVRRIKDGTVSTLIFRDLKQEEGGLTSPIGLLVQDGRLYICDTFARKVFVYQLG